MSTRPKVRYSTAVQDHDHTDLAGLNAYAKFRQALNDLADEAGSAGVTLAELLAALRDVGLTTPYADCCDRCLRDGVGVAERMAWPHKVHRDDGGWLTCTYRCAGCSHVWTCGYAASFPDLFS